MTPELILSAALERLSSRCDLKSLGVAVSGGSDSLALLHLVKKWSHARGIPLLAATVDHGLRAEAADEARAVARICAGLEVPHETLLWTGWDRQGNLQNEARQARKRLLREWSGRHGLDSVMIGHTADDQAETVLMRLSRGSGVDGLAGIPEIAEGGLFCRPLLRARRQELRDWLSERHISWIDDPSNDNPKFDRVRARKMMGLLSDLGLTVDRLVETAAHMGRAKSALDIAASDFARRHMREEAGDLILDRAALTDAPEDTVLRVLSETIRWIGNAEHRPRLDALQRLTDLGRAGNGATLGGVLMRPEGNSELRFCREASRAAPRQILSDQMIWDGRWKIAPPAGCDLTGLEVGPLGRIRSKAWHEESAHRTSIMASPAIWAGEHLIAAPLIGSGEGWRAEIVRPFRFLEPQGHALEEFDLEMAP